MSGNATLPYWIQRADFTSTDFDPVALDAAVALLTDHDWTGELAMVQDLQASGAEHCEPGVGFHRASRSGLDLFHACPDHLGGWTIYLKQPFELTVTSFLGRLLGRAPSTVWQSETRTFQEVPLEGVSRALRAFYEGDHDRADALLGMRA